jgi:23S rRNA (pseudouridine1915-N3)-methyltransferase
MLVRVLAIGTKMPDWVDAGVEEYRRRLSGDIRLEFEEIPLPKRRGDTVSLIAEEGAASSKATAEISGHSHRRAGGAWPAN